MKKRNIVKKASDFNRIIQKKQGKSNSYFIINKEKNNENISKFGITFSKNIGNSVTRNKIKRRIKNIIDNNKNIYESGNTYIIIAKKSILDIKYMQMEQELINIFKTLKGEKNEK